MTDTVKLTYAEMQVAATVGIQRYLQNLKLKTEPAYGAEDNTAASGLDVLGCIGEMAVAKYFNKYWSGAVGNYQAADVDRYQVRSTMYRAGRLILHREDDPCIFILVIITHNLCKLAGWIHADDGRDEKYWKDIGNGRPAFWVPQNDLIPMKDFPNG